MNHYNQSCFLLPSFNTSPLPKKAGATEGRDLLLPCVSHSCGSFLPSSRLALTNSINKEHKQISINTSTIMQGDAQSTRSRQTGISRKSSIASRQSQLVKKATGPTDLRPSDILIERFEAWKNITKNLIAYFEGQSMPFDPVSRLNGAILTTSSTQESPTSRQTPQRSSSSSVVSSRCHSALESEFKFERELPASRSCSRLTYLETANSSVKVVSRMSFTASYVYCIVVYVEALGLA